MADAESENGHVNLQTDPSHVHTSHTLTHTASRSNRGFTKKLQDMMKQRSVMEGRGGDRGKDGGRKEKSELRNWKQLTDRQLSKLTPIERSRYMAYEPLPKTTQEKQRESLKRVRTTRKVQQEQQLGPTLDELIEVEHNSELVGQLKAAEARDRIRHLRTTYEQSRAEELQYLIASQPSSIDAVRLRTFVPPHPHSVEITDFLKSQERVRCEVILEDEKGLTINRTA